jgi:hypothetical protein
MAVVDKSGFELKKEIVTLLGTLACSKKGLGLLSRRSIAVRLIPQAHSSEIGV